MGHLVAMERPLCVLCAVTCLRLPVCWVCDTLTSSLLCELLLYLMQMCFFG